MVGWRGVEYRGERDMPPKVNIYVLGGLWSV